LQVPTSNVEIAKRGFETLASRGVDAFLDFIHPEFVSVAPPELSVEPQTYRGREGVKRWFSSWYEAVDEVRLEPEEFIDAGEQVVIPLRIVVRGHDSGIEVGQGITWVSTLRDGLVVRMDTYADKEAALQALGMNVES
jgi:ketosteroid isomerase-like protein